jgi:hypothetical protein
MNQFEVANHPEVQAGCSREREVRKDGEHPWQGAGGRYTGLLFVVRHAVTS